MFKIGGIVRIINNNLFAGCEGVVIEIEENGCWLELIKSSGNITNDEMRMYDVFIMNEDMESIIRLDTKRLREEKETRIISTEESLIDIVPFYDPSDFN